MASIKDILIYLIKHYPHKKELSNARLTKMIYLADWLSAIRKNRQLTNINWYYDNYGPFVWDVFDCVKDNADIFNVQYTTNVYGGEKRLINLKKDVPDNLSNEEKRILDEVIENTKSLYWTDFIKLIYSTYPILTSEKYSYLDLVNKAKEWKEDQ